MCSIRRLNSFERIVLSKIRRILLLSIGLSLYTITFGQDLGLPPYQYFSPQDYLAASRNWSIVTDTSGVVYVANEDGVLRYDGISWDLIELPFQQKAYWVEMGRDGAIYVGANGDFGRLVSNPKGRIIYLSLANDLPDEFKDFNVVWEVISTSLGVTFRSRKYLFRYSDEELVAFKVPEKGRIFDAAYTARDRAHFRIYGLGLAYLDEYGIQVLPNSSFFAEKKVNGIYNYGENKLLIATRFEGLFIYDENQIVPFHSEVDNYLKQNKIYDGHHLQDGNYALATMADGLVIITPEGEEVFRFDSSNGLGNNATLFVTERDGHLWLATKNGIIQMAHKSPYRLVGEEFGLKGQVSDIFQWGNQQYVACNDGFYQLESDKRNPTFKAVNENTIVDCVKLFEHDNTLHLGSLEGVFKYKEGQIKQLSKFTAREVVATSQEHAYLASEFYFGLYLISFEGEELVENRIEGINRLVTQIVKIDEDHFWIKTIDDVLFEITIDFDAKGTATARVQQRLTLLPDTYILKNGDVNLLVSGDKLYRVKSGELEFTGDDLSFQYEPRKIVFAEPLNNMMYLICYEDAHGSTFCENFRSGENGNMSATGAYMYVGFRPNTLFYDEQQREIWLGGADGVSIFSENESLSRKISSTMIRQMTINDSAVAVRPGLDHELEHLENNINFSFTANSGLSEGKALFQYRMKGGNEDWSNWSAGSRVIFSNLGPNDYEFQVRSKSPYSGLSGISSVKFRINHPWYRSMYAYFLYFSIILIGAYLIYRIRVNTLVYNQKVLTRSVANKTRELAKANTALKDKAEKLERLSEFRSRFFSNVSHDLRTPIALLSGRIQLLQEDEVSQLSDKASLYLQRLQVDATKLVGLVDDIQELVQMEEEQLNMNFQMVEAEPYFKNITSLFESSCREKGIDLRFKSVVEAGVEVELDPHYFERVTFNLLSNAQKFTDSGGYIELIMNQDSQYLILQVKDTGVGIPASEIEEIFNRNFQANNQLKRADGLGIGLNVVRELVHLHQGKIEVQSEQGKGTDFTISLPWKQQS